MSGKLHFRLEPFWFFVSTKSFSRIRAHFYWLAIEKKNKILVFLLFDGRTETEQFSRRRQVVAARERVNPGSPSAISVAEVCNSQRLAGLTTAVGNARPPNNVPAGLEHIFKTHKVLAELGERGLRWKPAFELHTRRVNTVVTRRRKVFNNHESNSTLSLGI